MTKLSDYVKIAEAADILVVSQGTVRTWADPVQVAEDHPQSRDQRRRLGNAPQRHLTPIREAEIGPNRGEGNQSLGGRSNECV